MPKALVRRSSTYPTRRRWTAEDAKAALDALARSGLPASAFAAREGLDVQRLFRWRRRLGAPAPEEPRFEEVVRRDVVSALYAEGEARSSGERNGFEVVLRSGVVVRVVESFNTDALRRLLTVLVEVEPC
jgi:transposase-like protein